MSLDKILPPNCSADDVLSTLLESNIVSADGVRLAMKKKQLALILSHHEHKIWKGADGRWKTYIPDEAMTRGHKQISRESRKDIEDFLYDHYLKEDEEYLRKNVTMTSLYDEWAEYKSLYVSAATLRRDKSTWNSHYKNSEIANRPTVSLTKDDLDRWIISVVRTKDMNTHQYNNFAGVARQMFDYAYEQGIIEQNPMDKVNIRNKRLLRPGPKKPSTSEVFTREERRMIIEAAYRHYDEQKRTVQRFTPLAIIFLFYVSLRRGELVAIRFDDIEGNKLILKDSFSHDTKSLKGRLKDRAGWRTLTLPQAALYIIEKVRAERERLGMPTEGYIFTVNEMFESQYCALGRAMSKYCKELEIAKRSVHKTRKTCASIMHAAGIDDLTI